MNIYLYLDSETLIHRLDPRTKLFILAAVFILSVLHPHPYYILPVMIMVVFHAWVSRCFSNIFRIRFLLIIISLFSILLWSIYAHGTTFLIWRVSLESFLYGVGVAIKLDTMLIAGIVFLSTTKNEDITQGLIRLKIPYSFSFAFSTALRLLPSFIGTSRGIIQAQKSRGHDLESGNIVSRTKKHIPLLVPIFLTTIRSTDQLAMALEVKGFRNRKTRTFYNNLKFTGIDWMIIFFVIAVFLVNLWITISGFGTIPGLKLTP